MTTTQNTTRRRFRRAGAALLAAGVVLGAAGCGSSDETTSSSDQTVTITHPLGTTTVTGTPSRIVALDMQWLDAAQALGTTPVGYVNNLTRTTGSTARAPWEPEALSQAKEIDSNGDIVEQVGALRPDLILAPPYATDQATYDKLSKLAPTIAGLDKAEVANWESQVTTLGKVMHKEADAQQVVDDLHGKIDALGTRLPGLKDKTFLTTYLADPSRLMVLADPDDGSSQLFQRLGMKLPQHLVDEAATTKRIAVSPERVGDLNSDLLVATASPEMEQTFKQLPGYSTLPSVQHDGIAFIDVTTGTALNLPSALSLPYVLDKLTPAFERVAR